MGVLERFERRLGGFVEGAFAKVFKGEVEPVEIAGALQREADDRKTIVGQGKILVPNDYVVELGEHDHARLEPWAEPLGSELAKMVAEHAGEQGYSFVGPVTVTFELTPNLGTGAFRVRSGVTAGAVTAPPNTGARRPEGAQPGQAHLVLTAGGDEQVFPLTHSVTVIGRTAEADLRLDDPGVSRRHAEIRAEAGGYVVIDLGSTNGVRVNDAPVAKHRLDPGDRIELGSTTLQFRRDGD